MTRATLSDWILGGALVAMFFAPYALLNWHVIERVWRMAFP
jgi:hypothetical protein